MALQRLHGCGRDLFHRGLGCLGGTSLIAVEIGFRAVRARSRPGAYENVGQRTWPSDPSPLPSKA